MIKKLRKKFIIINMMLVTIVLFIVFISICFSSYQRMDMEINNSIKHVLKQRQGKEPFKFEMDKRPPKEQFSMYPVFGVILDKDSNIISIIKDNAEISDDTINNLINEILSCGKNEGTIFSLNVKFICIDIPDGKKIAFADLSNMKNYMKNLIVTSLIVGAGGLLAFFFISLFLSNIALTPVEEAWNFQHQFIADASHELKTPLTVILANIDILLLHKNDTIQTQIKWIQYIKDESDRMKKLVDDLLFLAKSDNPSKNIVYSKLNFSDIVWSCLLPFESVVFEKGASIESNIDSDISFSGNEEQLKRLIMILLDNACKYTDKSGVINVELKEIQDKIILKVNNSGSPIPEKDIENIFKRFYRADKSRSREEGGYGLGLSIAENIVENHKGKISVESNKRIGTTFIITLFKNRKF